MSEYIIGIIVLAAFFTAIVAMLAVNYKLVAESKIEDAKKEMKKEAMRRADKLFQNYIRTCEFRVVRDPVVLINESDIDWGNTKEVRF